MTNKTCGRLTPLRHHRQQLIHADIAAGLGLQPQGQVADGEDLKLRHRGGRTVEHIGEVEGRLRQAQDLVQVVAVFKLGV